MIFINNVKWVSISQIIKVSCQLLGMMIFARYLSTLQFGLMSMTLVVCGFINIIRDMGFTAAIIQRENISENFKSSVFYFNLVVGIFAFSALFLLSPIIAEFFHQEQLTNILRVISIAFPINSITSIHLSLLERESKFFQIAKCESLSSFFSLITSIFLATKGFGVYSLVFQTLLYSLFSGIGFIAYTKWFPKFYMAKEDLLSTFSFSSNLVIFNFINYFSRNSDQIIIGRFFNAGVLGQYSLAYRVMLFPLQNITYVLTRSLYPVLSRSQNDKKGSLSLYLNTLKVIISIVSPLMFGMAVTNVEFVKLIFGGKWDLVPNIIFWLSPTAILQSLISTTGAVFMSQNKTNVLVRLTVFNAFLQISSFVFGGFFDILLLVKLYFLANLIMFFPNLLLAVKSLGGSLCDVFLFIYKPLLASFIMALVVYLINCLFFNMISSDALHLAVSVISGGVIYILLIFIFDRGLIRDLKNMRAKG